MGIASVTPAAALPHRPGRNFRDRTYMYKRQIRQVANPISRKKGTLNCWLRPRCPRGPQVRQLDRRLAHSLALLSLGQGDETHSQPLAQELSPSRAPFFVQTSFLALRPSLDSLMVHRTRCRGNVLSQLSSTQVNVLSQLLPPLPPAQRGPSWPFSSPLSSRSPEPRSSPPHRRCGPRRPSHAWPLGRHRCHTCVQSPSGHCSLRRLARSVRPPPKPPRCERRQLPQPGWSLPLGQTDLQQASAPSGSSTALRLPCFRPPRSPRSRFQWRFAPKIWPPLPQLAPCMHQTNAEMHHRL